jgi:integrase
MIAMRAYQPHQAAAALTVRECIASYLRHCSIEGVHGQEAKIDRERILNEFAGVYGDCAVADCKPYMLSDWVESHPQWRSVSTRRGKANMIRACFNWATEQERIDRNPFRNVRYREAERRPEMPDDVLEVLAARGNKCFERAVRFLRLTGCRLSELCRARWADVDLDKGVWVIPRHKSRRYTGKPKYVALVAAAVSLLTAMKTGPAPTLFPITSADHIFTNTRGTPWNRRTLGQQLTRLKRRYAIDCPATAHGIRHRAASAMVIAGAPLSIVAAQLGHSSPAVTSRYYVHLDGQMDALRAAAELGIQKGG